MISGNALFVRVFRGFDCFFQGQSDPHVGKHHRRLPGASSAPDRGANDRAGRPGQRRSGFAGTGAAKPCRQCDQIQSRDNFMLHMQHKVGQCKRAADLSPVRFAAMNPLVSATERAQPGFHAFHQPERQTAPPLPCAPADQTICADPGQGLVECGCFPANHFNQVFGASASSASITTGMCVQAGPPGLNARIGRRVS